MPAPSAELSRRGPPDNRSYSSLALAPPEILVRSGSPSSGAAAPGRSLARRQVTSEARGVGSDVHSPGNALDVTARRSDDGHILQLQVVNLEGRPIPCEIALDGFSPAMARGKRIEISGQLGDENTAENPRRIVPREKPWQHETKAGRLQATFAPQSFTILRLQ